MNELKTRMPWLLMGLLTLLAAPAGADSEDGGIRSVFAEGAGSRALAMGGAYAARADDASVLFWNPGALAWLTRGEFQAGHANLYGLGFNEQYASFVLPSWRYGVFAVGFRHFGVSGIEERDDRNVLLSENLTSSDHQLSLAFARSFGDAWSMGGTVKLRRQEVAGLAGSGMGLDFGLLARPARLMGWTDPRLEPLSVGVALSNLLEPSIRLDQDSVKDPGSFRLGFGYEVQLPMTGHFAPAWLLPVLDFEKVGDMSTRVHAGLELNYQPLALRCGYGSGHFSVGSGVAWRDFHLDYVYEGNELENVHRVSLSFEYGRTVLESRQAALRAQDQALQARLAAAFEKRQEARVNELLRDAQNARESGDPDAALEILGTLQALAPDQGEVKTLAARCLGDKAERLAAAEDFTEAAVTYRRALGYLPGDSELQQGLEHCQSESDARAARSEELRQRFAAALDAFSADRLVEARKALVSILADQPGDAEAEAMLARTEQAIAIRCRNLIDQAERFTRGGFLKEAAELLDQAQQLDSHAEGLAKARADYSAADKAWQQRVREAEQKSRGESIARAGASQTAKPRNRQLSREKQAEIADLYQRGNQASAEGRNNDAMRYWELVWSAQPGYEQVDELLKREYLTRGMELFASGRFEEATGLWEKALRIDPQDQRVLGYLDRARAQLAKSQEILHD